MSAALHEEDALGKAYDLQLLARLWTYVRPYRLQVAGTVLLVFPMFALEIAQPFLIRFGIDGARQQRQPGRRGLVRHPFRPGQRRKYRARLYRLCRVR